jgi:hypothetical protein
MKKIKKTNTHGGAGRGQGRHQKYNEETENITFRCPLSKKEVLRQIVHAQLEKWAKEAQKAS